jgi:hypothetical protein
LNCMAPDRVVGRVQHRSLSSVKVKWSSHTPGHPLR